VADQEHLDKLKEGVKAWNEWRIENLDIKPDLSEANLRGANLRWVILSDTDLIKADLSRADLGGANFRGANLSRADLSGADLEWAELNGTSLFDANLQKIKFRGATLSKLRLRGAVLSEADLTIIHIDRETIAQIPDALRKQYEETWIILKDESVIERSIEFPPEYHQAGISILNEFGSVLRTKYPDTKAKLRIEQDGLKVTMTIDPVEGEREVFEEELDRYGLVVNGRMPLNEYTDDKFMIIRLESQLRRAHDQIETEKSLRQLAEGQHGEQIKTLKEDVQWLRSQIGVMLTHSDKTTQTVSDNAQASMNLSREALQVVSGYTQDFIRLLEKHADIRAELEFLHTKLNSTAELSETDVREIQQKLILIGERKPGIRQKLAQISAQVIVGATGSGVWSGIFEVARLLLP